MGNLMTVVSELFNFQQDKRLLMLGLDAAGKTTLLYKLRLGETVHTIPTIGFNVEKVKYKNIEWTMWDIGGQEKIRPLWKHYYQGVDAIIFVVDSNDRDRIEEATEELKKLMSEDLLKKSIVLVYANKQDLPNAFSVSELTARLGLYDVKSRPWFVQSCVASRGDGVYEGLQWLSEQLKKQKSRN